MIRPVQDADSRRRLSNKFPKAATFEVGFGAEPSFAFRRLSTQIRHL
jgi:hypothetical protein